MQFFFPGKAVIILLLFYTFHTTSAQPTPLHEEIRFISYLIDNSEYREAIFLINKLSVNTKNAERLQLDSLYYYAGRAFFGIKNLDSSAWYYDKVSDASAFYHSSKFYQAYNYIYTGRYDSAKVVLNNISILKDSSFFLLKNFELAGISLLQHDFHEYHRLAGSFNADYYSIDQEEENFRKYKEELSEIKKKSAFLAGLFSAVIPGSGKLYAGYRGQAISAFLPVTLLGAVALENFLKAGLKSPQFLIFSGIFSVFYLGNVWGSALSVSTKRQEDAFLIKEKILLDLHLPLRRVFY